jgi:glycosyltransferase involved in cell wall biosynthesis
MVPHDADSRSRDDPGSAAMTGPSPGGGPLRVALLGPCTWPEVRRGAERMFRDLAAGLIDRGHRPWLITSHRGWPSRTVEGGLEVTRHWRPPQSRLERRGYESYLTHVPASYLSLMRGDAEIAHASHAPDAIAAVRWGRRRRRPTVFSFMGIPDRQWLVARRGRLHCMLGAVRGCDAVVALSRTAADEFARSLGVRARVINPGVDTRAFAPGGERAPEPRIVCTASLEVPEKRVGLLVAALGAVRRVHPRAVLVLQRPADPGLAAAVVAEPGVELIDADPGLLPDAYRSAWISALPSRSDAFGLAVAESLACGTPVVGSDRGGIPEIIDRPEIGRVFRGDTPGAVADALLDALELANDPTTSGACRARAEELSVERCVDAYEALYRELL